MSDENVHMPRPGRLRDEAVEMWIAHRRTPKEMAERLELWATNEAGERIPVGCDGIAARNVEIELLTKRLTESERIAAARNVTIGELGQKNAALLARCEKAERECDALMFRLENISASENP